MAGFHLPASAGIVPLGCKAWKVSTYEANACAVLRNGAIRCWGAGEQNGYGNTETIGDDETPASAGDVPIW